MFKRFLPYEASFFDFFDQHISLVVKGAEELLSLFQMGINSEEKANSIKNIEHEADLVTYHCIEALRKTFITPFEREDIYHLISRLDDILDFIEETAARVVLYKLTQIKEEIKEMATLLVYCTQDIQEALKGLSQLKQLDHMKQVFSHIHTLENKADIILREAIGRLFEESDIKLLIKWKEIFENLEMAIDRCQEVSNIIEGVILEYG